MEVIFNGDLLLVKIKITYLILSPLVICYFRLILIFDLDHFLCDLPYLWTTPNLFKDFPIIFLILLGPSVIIPIGQRIAILESDE